MTSLWLALFLVGWLPGALVAQSPTSPTPTSPTQASALTPTDTVQTFYRLLREQRFTEAFQLHVCGPAVEKMTPQQLAELEPEFLKLIGGIPEKLTTSGETVTGDDATVFVVVPADATPGSQPARTTTAPVGLIRSNGRWLIGDRETQALALAHGGNFFKLSEEGVFVKMTQNEDAMARLVTQLVEIEQVFARNNRGQYGTLPELVTRRDEFREDIARLLASLESGEILGHTITIEVTPDRRDFAVYVVPKRHNYDGRYSFYADRSGVRYRNYGGARIEKDTPGNKTLN
ncbi:hypothetical protein [Chloracidobacterium aggregatum]|uniref:DUF4440 domain-containing protein n=1 Tax=Chloracidobacterium sp. N TaxID=2821540 RepID=A0ABX8AYV3_9BACT|nr:hypothetical protein [Chloracidobacterium aggregatum]QUV93898.1 hypothetical protein J8C05_00055 [Chloracidobacterium sp. N]